MARPRSAIVLDEHRGELFAALAAAGYGSAYVATSFALRSFDPLPAAVWRSLLAAIVLGFVVALRRRAASPVLSATVDPGARGAAGTRGSLPGRLARLLVLGVFAGPVFLAAMNLAVAHVGATIAAFVAGLYAVLSAVIAPALLPERLTSRALAGFVAALLGTALLAELNAAASDLAGIGWGLLAAVSFALFLVLARRWSAPYRLDGSAIALTTVLATVVALAGIMPIVDIGPLVPPSAAPEALVAIGWLAAVAALGQLLTVASVRLIPAQRSAAFLLLNPITATILGAVLLGERPSALQVAGGALVLAGIALATGALRLPVQPKPAGERYSGG